jgi:N-dimethylarginine dimethylaminohydrolase
VSDAPRYRRTIRLEDGRRGYRRAVLMGDPTHFSVKGGANPHTRTRWGMRRGVDRKLAIRQWSALRDLLLDLGVRVLVVPPDAAQPGLVYPANAGFLSDLDAEKPLSKKFFYLANLLPTRAGEKPHYRRVLESAGFRCCEIDERYRFEGEADFFPLAGHYLFTYGQLETQRFVPSWGLPPWKRVYGFRSDRRVEPLLRAIVDPRPILEIELLQEAHYHGDTALCAFGPERKLLLAYHAAITPHDWDQLRQVFGDGVIELEDDDAQRYAANSFTLTQGDNSVLLMPAGVSPRLQDQVRERGVTPIPVDVSEFLKKGGGSVKCMIGDLGPVEDGVELGSYEVSGGSGSA